MVLHIQEGEKHWKRCSRGHTWEESSPNYFLTFSMGDTSIELKDICYLCLGEFVEKLIHEGKIGIVIKEEPKEVKDVSSLAAPP